MNERHEHYDPWPMGRIKGMRFCRHVLNYPRDDKWFADRAQAFELTSKKEIGDGKDDK